MSGFTPSASKNKNAEIIRVLIPIIIVVAVILLINHFFGSIFSGIGDVAKGAEAAGKSTLQAIGAVSSDQAAAAKTAGDSIANKLNTLGTNDYFNASYYKGKNQTLKTSASIKTMADEIWNAIGVLSNDQASIVAVFKQCENKSQVSQLAEAFQTAHGQDLLTFLVNDLSNGHTDADKIAYQEILTYTESLS
jgi:poly(3-hydroxybutyrate) depolymerase